MRTCFLVPLTIIALSLPALAADLTPRGEFNVATSAAESVRRYVEQRALLHIIRGVFDIEPTEDIAGLVAQDLDDALRDGLTADEQSALEDELIAEGSYFIVSLDYLIEAGVPAWPEDRPPENYENDAKVLLAPLKRSLVEAVQTGQDALSVFETAARVYFWTEGLAAGQSDRANFAQRDAIVSAAYEQLAVKPDDLNL
jgi:hypothetical protein